MSTTQGQTLSDAHRQWAVRPADERFTSLEALHAHLVDRSDRSLSAITSNKAMVVRADQHPTGRLWLETSEWGDVDLTHWSFSQLVAECAIEAPTGEKVSPRTDWCRAAHPMVSAMALNYGLKTRSREETLLFGLRRDRDDAAPSVLRAMTSPGYGRWFDHQSVEAMMRVNDDLGRVWHVPAASGERYEHMTTEQQQEATTLYAGDRDFFLFLVDEDHPIEIRRPGARPRSLFRGIFVSGSEVRARSWEVTTFIYDFVCANRYVWGSQEVRRFAIRHTKNGPERFEREGREMLVEYMNRSASEEQGRIQRAIDMELFHDKDPVEWLRSQQFSLRQAEAIVTTARAEEGRAVSLWDIVSGGTALARKIEHQDRRVDLERRVSSLLDLAA